MNFLKRINRDIEVVFERDPAATTKLEVVLNYPGLHAIWAHRLTHKLYQKNLRVLARANTSAKSPGLHPLVSGTAPVRS